MTGGAEEFGSREDRHLHADELRTVLGHFPSGVVILTGIHQDKPIGMTCQSFFSLSLVPPLVSFAPGRASTSWPKLASSGKVAINILRSDHETLARGFAASGSDKFNGVSWTRGRSGAPLLSEALAWIECVIEQVSDAGDHYLVVAKVVEVATAAGEPLVFYRSEFKSLIA
jgi:3-hydroxy-9,10-secoandrosta-1,3,5(10)-triene-9,17-dione monooxygenase reductase component